MILLSVTPAPKSPSVKTDEISGLTLQPRPTALLAVNDEAAATTIRVATEMGIKVPGDLSIVGFSDELLASFTLPTLTTVAQPHTDIGRR
ncbi:MAG: substrate-binding domain-containing protein, partial [Phycisphaerae bacterium]